MKYETEIEEIIREFPDAIIPAEDYWMDRFIGNYNYSKKALVEYPDELKALRLEILEKLGVPKRLRVAIKGNIDHKIWEKINTTDSLFIYGPAGTGKSYLAAAVIGEEIDGFAPRMYINSREIAEPFAITKFSLREATAFISVPDLLLQIRSTFHKDSSGTEEEIIDQLTTDRPRVFDDLGAEKTSEWSLQTLYTIIDRRYREEQQTIFTSNLSLQSIGERLGDRIASRIAGMCKVIELRGKDRRIGKP